MIRSSRLELRLPQMRDRPIRQANWRSNYDKRETHWSAKREFIGVYAS